jgi:hypothetical protein
MQTGSSDSHWLEIWKATFVPLWDRMEGRWLWPQGAISKNPVVKDISFHVPPPGRLYCVKIKIMKILAIENLTLGHL